MNTFLKYLFFLIIVISISSCSDESTGLILSEKNDTQDSIYSNDSTEVIFTVPLPHKSTRGYGYEDINNIKRLDLWLKTDTRWYKSYWINSTDPNSVYTIINFENFEKDSEFKSLSFSSPWTVKLDTVTKSIKIKVIVPKRNSELFYPYKKILLRAQFSSIEETVLQHTDNYNEIYIDKYDRFRKYEESLYGDLYCIAELNSNTSQLVLKRFYGEIKVLSDNKDDMPNLTWYWIHPLYSCDPNIRFMEASKRESETNRFCNHIVPEYYFDENLTHATYYPERNSLVYNANVATQLPPYGWNPIWSTASTDLINEDGRNFYQLVDFFPSFNPSGKLPTLNIPDANYSHLNGQELKYLVLLNPIESNGGWGFKNIYRYAIIPLPEKMYPSKTYIIKNKPGTRFFSDKLDVTQETRSSSKNVIDPDNIIIEEHDMFEDLPFEMCNSEIPFSK